MAVKFKKPNKKNVMPVSVCIGILISVFTTVISSCITAVLIAEERLSESAMGFAAVLILLIATAAGTLVGTIISGHRRMLICLFVACGFFAVLLSCTALFFGGMYQGVGVTALVILGAALGCGVLRLNAAGGATRTRQKTKIR